MSENTKKNIETRIKVSEETLRTIFADVEECYKSDIKEAIQGKKCWRHTGLTFETISKVTVAIGGVLSFSSGYFNSNILSFVSGSVSVVSLALLQFGTFSFKQGKKQANDLNILLQKLDLDTMPVMDDEPDALTNGNERKAIDKGIPTIYDIDTLNVVSDDADTKLQNPHSNTHLDTNTDSDNHLDIELDNSFRKSKPKIKNIIILDDTKNDFDNKA